MAGDFLEIEGGRLDGDEILACDRPKKSSRLHGACCEVNGIGRAEWLAALAAAETRLARRHCFLEGRSLCMGLILNFLPTRQRCKLSA